ncbi:MAG TPA: hypothetical protein VLB50_07495 [Ignavibacteriaceae bacterium]|nr:hypothetical protein [Ignavibacteriaceae bacterium]
MKIRKIFPIIISFSLIILEGCSSTPELISTTENNIKIDGNVDDWGTNLKYFSDENASVGVSNDNHYFYLCLTTNELGSVMPMFAKGFVVWLENEKSDSSIGIKYPLHNIVNEARIMINPEAFRRKGRGMMLKELIDEQNEIRILNKDNFPETVISTSDSSGLTAKIGYINDQFVYELRVPIDKNDKDKYYLSSAPGEKILVKFETETPERRNFGGGRGGSIMDPGGMGYPGGGYGGESGGERMPFNPINFEVEVTLK